ncbi:MAG: NAD(+)/NADH kinase [Spirochaetaceae bacterium]|jgi:NAD+ kinase|nr:NAD(+)/NADH kinase [Spirochaetaceae bacterium]
MKVLLIVNPKKSAAQELVPNIKKELEKKNIRVSLFSYTDSSLPASDFDIAFSLGGDGTVLFAARSLAALGIPILPLNLGSLGFIAAVHPNEWQDVFEDWRSGKALVSERLMLNIRVLRGEKFVFEMTALNDAVISASGISKTIRLEAFSEDNHLAYYRSDGLIISTPTGSTAYNAAAGGPILDPRMEALVINPICPFTLFSRALVMSAHEIISVNIEKEQRSAVLLTIDGQLVETLEPSDKVLFSKSEFCARLIASDRGAFYQALHSKLVSSPSLPNGDSHA